MPHPVAYVPGRPQQTPAARTRTPQSIFGPIWGRTSSRLTALGETSPATSGLPSGFALGTPLLMGAYWFRQGARDTVSIGRLPPTS